LAFRFLYQYSNSRTEEHAPGFPVLTAYFLPARAHMSKLAAGPEIFTAWIFLSASA
jgi:hypothetical protein